MKLLKCPATDEWIKMWCIHICNIIQLLKQSNAICSNVDGRRDCHTSEVSQIQKVKYHMISHVCGIEKKGKMNLLMKQK